MTGDYGIFGGLALFAGIVLLFFPKTVFYLIGLYMLVNAAIAFDQGAEMWLVVVLGLGGILVFIAPKMVAWFIAFYLALFSVLLFFWGYWFVAIPGIIVAFLVILIPKILPMLTAGILIVAGGLTLLAAFVF